VTWSTLLERVGPAGPADTRAPVGEEKEEEEEEEEKEKWCA
jgi:hypothetical protein